MDYPSEALAVKQEWPASPGWNSHLLTHLGISLTCLSEISLLGCCYAWLPSV